MFVAPKGLACSSRATDVRRTSEWHARSVAAFDIHPRTEPRRSHVQAFIHSVYKAEYGADVARWSPTLVSLTEHDALVAAAGYRRASHRLFLERYLGAPVELLIADSAAVRVSRRSIFEVAHLASTRPGAGRAMMVSLARHLADVGCTWVVCTATRELRVLFGRMGLKPIELGPALPSRLGADAASWGSYDEHAPVVLAGSLESGLSALDRRG